MSLYVSLGSQCGTGTWVPSILFFCQLQHATFTSGSMMVALLPTVTSTFQAAGGEMGKITLGCSFY